MDVLRNLFGNVTSGLIRLAVAVGILAAAYFFVIKPVLHTTENVSNSINTSIQTAQDEFQQSFGPHSQEARALRRAGKQAQVQITHSFRIVKKQGSTKGLQRLQRCVERSNGNVNRMQRCANRFAP